MVEKTKLAYEKRYSDGSGVEFGIYYDSNETCTGADHKGTVTFDVIDKISIPTSQLDWFIECLADIRSELL